MTRTETIVAGAATAAAWLESNSGSLRQDAATLVRDFRRYGRRAARLAEAATRPMCAAVFGASQAGKSYLVSRLAAPAGRRLAVKFGEETLDFLKDINPPGGQEATGLVTRFTLRPLSGPAGAPVALRLLTQTDLVKILANTFLEDFDIDIALPDPAALERVFADLAAQAGPAPRDAMSADDVEDLAEYFERHFRNHALLQSLNAVGFWPRAVDLAPRLPAAARADLFAPLWGGTQKFTESYRQLVAGLQALAFAATAYAGLDALVPRESSIIDVRALFSLGGPPAGELRLTAPGGGSAILQRSVVAALVAELGVTLAERPWPFFDTTDLLDFPGARTREAISDIDRFLAQPEKLGRALLRGKVAYLFQRYNAEQEITAMLLCVGPSNQEVQTLPRMVQDWIEQAIGATPQARAPMRNSLFLVLTKFDSEFEEKAGEEAGSATRWTARLQASLVDFFGKAYEWPNAWTPGRPFDNIFWLRNPSIGFGAVFDYHPTGSPDAGAEIGVAPRAAAFVAERRAAYLANPLVQRHVADPAIAWDSALLPNDGGIARLAGALAPVCDPALKAAQVGARTEELARTMAERLRPLWRSDDRAAELAQAKTRAAGVVRALLDCARAQMFGPLLRALQISPDQVAGVHWRMQTEPDDAPAPIGAVGAVDDYADELAGILGAAEAPPPDPAEAGPRDYFERFAGLTLSAWDEALHGVAADPATATAYRLPAEQAALLVGQILAASRRLDLRGQIAQALRERAGFHGRAGAGAGKIILVAEDRVNGFVTCLGFDRLAEARRPTVGSGPAQRRIFAARPTVRGLPRLGDQPAPYDRSFHVDWMTAFARMMEDNVVDQSAETFDRNANDALGALLTRLAVPA